MSEMPEGESDKPGSVDYRRCPNCDSMIPAGDTRCVMCGEVLTVSETADAGAVMVSEDVAESDAQEPVTQASPDVVVSVMRERQSPVVFWLTAIFAVIIIVLAGLVLRFQGPPGTVAMGPTTTSIPATQTFTPTWTPLPTDVALTTDVPTATPSPQPMSTPQPPRLHQVNAGETLIGLSLRYRVSVESIAEANDMAPDQAIRVEQTLRIPWPTATPPLVPVAVTVRGINVVADPTDCIRHEVRGGDTLLKIAAQHDVDLELLMRVNRMSEETILQPGDSLCIPEIVIGATMPATPGPTPTPTPTLPPAGPQLLYPAQNAIIDEPDAIVALQWVAVKDLDESEWYMIEVADIDEVDSLPHRGFTRDTSFRLPGGWRPTDNEDHLFRWRISVVRVTGERSDGAKIYIYGGESSEDGFFTWRGTTPTTTPFPRQTATPDS